MRQGIRNSLVGSLALGGAWLGVLAVGALPAPASAQVVTTATQDLSCLGTRAGQTLGCSAGDLTATAVLSAEAGTPLFCQAGQSFNFNADVTINKSAGNTRYDIGFFTGQTGNNPTVSDASKQCSVATLPFNPAPMSNQEAPDTADVCGDIAGTQTFTPKVQNIKVACVGASATDSNLSVPFALSWLTPNTFTCKGPGSAGLAADGSRLDMPVNGAVYTDNKSKCSTGTATVSVSAQNLQVGGYVDVTKQTTPDGDTQSFSYTATGPSGSMVGYQALDGSGAPTGNVISNNNQAVSFSLGDGQGVRVFMSVVASNRTLTIVEQRAPNWQSTAAISCSAVTGSPGMVVNNANRSIGATLNTTNSAAACTVTNTKRARISMVENVAGRLFGADQFEMTVSGVGAATLTDGALAVVSANDVAVTTSGSATGPYTNPAHPSFWATPGQSLSLANAMAAGSTSTPASYDTTLTCSNAFNGPGATTGLPNNQATSSHAFAPAPGDDITCTYTNTPKALLTLSKSVVNDQGRTATATDWILRATGPATISGVSGAATVTGVPVPPGNYVLDESGPSGYALTGLACTGGADPDPSDGLALASGENVACTFTNDDQAVAQTVVKTALLDQDPDGSGTVTAGDTLRYTVTVTNTGLVPLTNVVVSDAQLTPNSRSCANVAVDGTCVLDGTRVVTADDALAGEIVNAASVTSNEIPGPVASNTVTTTVQDSGPGALAVVKSHAGDFVAGGNATYTLQVRNTGSSLISGTTTVDDTLASGLGFVSGGGTGWSCSAAGQVVTCTSTDDVPAYASMPAITLVVSVAGSMGGSVDNTAAVGNSSVNGGAMAAGNTDTALILHPDLSTSTKGVVDLNGGDVEAGDVLEYRINLVESAGVAAGNVHVTDTLQAGLGNLVVTQVPGGGTDNSTAGQVDVSGIGVPANGSVQLAFQVTVGAGFDPGDTIDNTAAIDNPGGPDAAPAARTLVFDQSGVGGSGNKILYLHDDNTMDRTPQAGTTTSGLLVEAGTSEIWMLDPAIPAGETLVLSPGTVTIRLPVDTSSSEVKLQAQLFYRDPAAGDLLIASSSVHTFATSAVVERPFNVDLASGYTLSAGGKLGLRLVNSATGNKHARIHEYNVTAAAITFATSTVVRVDSVQAYSQAFADGNAQAPYYVHGDDVWIRAVASDPFGGEDVSAAVLTLVGPYGNVIAGPTAMAIVDTADVTVSGSRTFEYATTIPALVDIGTWTATVTAHEGSEGIVQHTINGQFEVRGRVTLQQAWGAGANPGDSLLLQVAGGSDAVDGSSTAPSTMTPATATATATAPITLAQAFTSGDPGTYTITLSCLRDADGAALALAGSGLSREIQMPLDSSVTCTWTNAPTVPLTLVKLVLVRSDPVNGTTNPKAIPGAVVEYRLVVANPSANVIDSGSVIVTDPLPQHLDLRVLDIAGAGSGPVLFTEGSPASGLVYTFTALGSTTDDVDFSNNDGATWDYVPVPDADGLDPGVTDIRINPKGPFNGNNAQFTLSFRLRIP